MGNKVFGTEIRKRYGDSSEMVAFPRKRSRQTVRRIKTAAIAKYYGFQCRSILVRKGALALRCSKCVVKLLSHSDLLWRPPLRWHNFPGFCRHFSPQRGGPNPSKPRPCNMPEAKKRSCAAIFGKLRCRNCTATFAFLQCGRRFDRCILNYYPINSKTRLWGNSEITPQRN